MFERLKRKQKILEAAIQEDLNKKSKILVFVVEKVQIQFKSLNQVRLQNLLKRKTP
jgi:hypothetical protein